MKKYVIKFKDNYYLYFLVFINLVGEEKTKMNFAECKSKLTAMVFSRKALAVAIAKSLKAKVEEL